MDIKDFKLGAVVFVIGTVGALAMSMTKSDYLAGVTPQCMIYCFSYTVKYEIQVECQNEEATDFTISFTDAGPNGYNGESCINDGQQNA